MNFLAMDVLFMISSDLWTDFDSRLGEIFIIIPETLFAGLSVMAVDKFLQLPLVRVKEVVFYEFSDKDSMKIVLGWQLWNFLKKAQLTEDVKQSHKFYLLTSDARNLLGKLKKFELSTIMMM